MQQKPDALLKQEQDTTNLASVLEQTELTRDNYPTILGVLVQCKANIKMLEAQRDEALVPAKETVNRIKGYFDESLKALSACESVIKGKATTLIGATAAHALTVAQAGQQPPPPLPSIEGVGVREGWDFKVINEGLLPPEFLVPDAKKIRAAMKDQMTEEGPFAIPGVKFFRKTTLVVTPPKA